MKQDVGLREAVRQAYYRHYNAADADFDRAERRRETAYLEAVDLAYLRRAARRETSQEFSAVMRQLQLL